MNKALNFLVAIALVAMVTVGCEKSPYEVEEVVPEAQATVLFASTGSEDASTRVNLEDVGSASELSITVKWRNVSAEDVNKITIYDDNGDRVCDFTYDGENNATSGEFIGYTTLDYGKNYTAVYPASTALTLTERNAEALDFAEQTQESEIAIINDAVRMKADFEYVGENTSMTFVNEMAIVSIDIAGQPNNKPQTLTFHNGEENQYVINYSEDAVEANTAIRTYIAVHPVSSTTERTLSFELIYTNGLDWKFETTTTKAYEAGVRYTMPVENQQTLYIATAEELAAFAADVNEGHNYSGRTVVLTDDITLSGEWTPIGIYDTQSSARRPFNGTFDGGNHTISGLTITQATTNYQGLFGYTVGATIKNLSISEPQISLNTSYLAAMIGYDYRSVIENCAVIGGSISGADYVGGIAGYSYASTTTSSYNTATISGEDYIGGIQGYSDRGAVTSCYNLAPVSGQNRVGGLQGHNYDCDVTACYNIAPVSGDVGIGGVIGYTDRAIVTSTYNAGAVSGQENTGGITGELAGYMPSITSCYNVGAVLGESYIGGITGDLSSSTATVANCFYLGGSASDAIGGYGYNVTDAQVTNATMVKTIQDLNNLVGIEDGLEGGEDNFSKSTSEADHLPNLMGENIPFENFEFEIYISNEQELIEFRESVASGETYQHKIVIVDDNITLTKEWTPICPSSEVIFKGTFDGGNYTISGLTITNATTDYQGLFGYVSGATIKNVTISKPQISSNKRYVGAVVGFASGTTIENCAVTGGSVNGNGNVGGVVGLIEDESSLTFSYNTSTVSSDMWSVGGVVGAISSSVSVSSCYNTGSVNGSGEFNVGGIAGYISSSSDLTSSYNTGTVVGYENVGGVVGSASSGTVTSCYNVGLVSGSSNIGGVTGNGNLRVTDCFYLVGTAATGISSGSGTATEVASVKALNDLVGATGGLLSGEANFSKGNSESDQLPHLMGESLVWGAPADLSIYNLQDLIDFRNAVNSGNTFEGKIVQLRTYITLTSEWTPIGTSSNPFKGTFDGSNYLINELTITNATSDNQGLFGYISGATIKNVRLRGLAISSTKNNVGGVVGYATNSSTIKNCSIAEYLVLSSIGGISNVGGVVGNASSSSVASCYNDEVSVRGTTNVGGVAGYSSSSVTSCYNIADVRGGSNIGGVVGNSTSSVTSCYNTAEVSGSTTFGAVVGNSSSSVANCFYLSRSASRGIGAGSGIATEITTIQALNDKVGAVNGLLDGEGNFSKGGTTDSRLPQLMSENLSWTNPLLADLVISNQQELINFRNAVNSGNTYEGQVVLLDSDIALTSQWTPIGNSTSTMFKGTFNGGNYTISGLTITNATADYQGLFGHIRSAVVENVKILNPQISSSGDYVGGLAGWAVSSSINNCAIIGGSIKGAEEVGGLVGDNSSYIRSSYNSAVVYGTQSVGGIAGSTSSSGYIYGCYNKGTVTANKYTGGLVGNSQIALKYCYNVGVVTGNISVGALVGNMSGFYNSHTISNCFYLHGTRSVAIGTYSSGASSADVINSGVVTSLSALNGKVGEEDGLSTYYFIKGANQTTQMPHLGIGGEGTGFTL